LILDVKMSDTFHKFLFLGAMIAVVAFANRGSTSLTTGGTVAEKPLRVTYEEAGKPQQPVRPSPPIFILENPSKALGNLERAISEGETVKALEEAPILFPPPAAPLKTSLEAQSVPFSLSALTTEDEQSETSIFRKIGNESPPLVGARIAFVSDLQSGERYLRLGVEKQWPIASITKLMTAAVAMRYGGLTERTAVSDQAFAVDSEEQNIKVGGTYRISDLLELMLLPSSNVAAEAIAEFYGRDAFLAVMNAQAAEWGLRNTHFSDPSGLSVSNQSTAEDILLFARRIARDYPEVFRIGREPSAVVAEWNENHEFTIKSINAFAGRADFMGGKTGYTEESGGNLLSVFSYSGRPIVIIVLGTDDRFGDTEKLLKWFRANHTTSF